MLLTVIGTIADTLKEYLKDSQALMLVIASIMALIGAIRVYRKWQDGDRDVSFTAAAWFGSSLFMTLVPTIIQELF